MHPVHDKKLFEWGYDYDAFVPALNNSKKFPTSDRLSNLENHLPRGYKTKSHVIIRPWSASYYVRVISDHDH